MRFASLGSGSRGNATLVEAGSTRVLVDNGFSVRECTRRLRVLGVEPESLSGVLLTHEHSDHVNGAAAFCARVGIPLYLTAGTQWVMEQRGQFDGVAVDLQRVMPASRFMVEGISVLPVDVPHDALEPCQYVFEAGHVRLGILTDIGSVTAGVMQAYTQCDALLLECNHDVRMLAEGPYHASLKARVSGDKGHLSNCQAADLLTRIDRQRLQHLVIGHLSEKNNQVSLARQAASTALGWDENRVVVATQATGHDWIDIGAAA